MKHRVIFQFSFLFIVINSVYIHAQVGVGTINPNSSAILHLESTDKGFLPPVMTQTERDNISTPPEGLTVYCTDCSPSGYYVYSSSSWAALASNSSLGLVSENGNVHGNLNNFVNTVAEEGTNNVGLGINALKNLETGDNNVAVGRDALVSDTSGTYNVAIGRYALASNLNGDYNVGIGGSALGYNTTGVRNVAIGFAAGGSGDSGVFIGYLAGTTSFENNKLFIQNDESNTPLIGGDFSKDRVGINTPISDLDTGATLQVGGNISLDSGVAVSAFSDDATLSHNSDSLVPTQKAIKTYIDNNSGSLVTDADANTHGNLNNFNSIRVGEAVDNLALGTNALKDLETGDDNIAIGKNSLANDTSGSNNVAIGGSALSGNLNGDYNIAIGLSTLSSIIPELANTGSSNLALGNYAGWTTTGDSNIFIGVRAGSSSSSGDNKLYIENSASNTPLIGGDFSTDRVGINTPISDLSSGATLQVGGNISLDSGVAVSAFSNDATLSHNSDSLVPTQKAIKTYIDNNSGGLISENGNVHGNLNNFVHTEPLEGTNNVALGTNALEELQEGHANVAVGINALINDTNGDNNVAVGYDALSGNSDGDRNIAIGSDALGSILGASSLGSSNIALGYEAGIGVNGDSSIYIGNGSGSNSGGSNRLYIDNGSIPSTPLIGGDFSTKHIGINTSINNLNSGATLQVGGNISLDSGVAISAFSNDAAFTYLSDSLVPTQKAISTYLSTNYINNSAIVSSIGSITSNSDVPSETAVKNYVDNNIGLVDAGNSNVHGNTFNMTSITTGFSNLALGSRALEDITKGGSNVAIGASALSSLDTGEYNIAIGAAALSSNKGSRNIAIGYGTGAFNSSTDSSIFLGHSAGTGITNRSNVLMIEMSSSSTPLLGGDFGSDNVGINVPVANLSSGSTLQVGGDAEVVGSANGVILESPDGNRWRITVDNSGNLTTMAL